MSQDTDCASKTFDTDVGVSFLQPSLRGFVAIPGSLWPPFVFLENIFKMSCKQGSCLMYGCLVEVFIKLNQATVKNVCGARLRSCSLAKKSEFIPSGSKEEKFNTILFFFFATLQQAFQTLLYVRGGQWAESEIPEDACQMLSPYVVTGYHVVLPFPSLVQKKEVERRLDYQMPTTLLSSMFPLLIHSFISFSV